VLKRVEDDKGKGSDIEGNRRKGGKKIKAEPISKVAELSPI